MSNNPWDDLNSDNDNEKCNKSNEYNSLKPDVEEKAFMSGFFGLKRSDKELNSENSKNSGGGEFGVSFNKSNNSDKKSSNKENDKKLKKDKNSISSNGFKDSSDGIFDDINNILEKVPFLNFRIKKNIQLFLMFFVVIVLLWFCSGFYIIRPEENAIVLRFGKYIREEQAGLHYHLPFPIENVIKEATTRVRIIKIGGENSTYLNNNNRELDKSWALTGDENIVNLELNIQWKIDNLKQFVFNVRDRELTIYDAAQSAIREVISKRKLADILTSGRGEIEEETKKLLQDMLNSYNLGVNILVVQMLKIDPPAQVIDSFRDVQTARVDKESEINKAYKYKNDVLPKVKGEAGKIIEDANGYAIFIINKAKGDVSRFNQVYEQYKNAPFITRKRMYLEAMEELFANNKITIIDDNVKNVFLGEKNNDDVDKKLSVLQKSEEE